MTQASMTGASPTSSSASGYTLRVVTDTWLKQSTAQSANLPDDQKQFVKAGSTFPIAAAQQADNNHVQITLGTDKIDQKVRVRGLSTWYAYRPAIEILKDGKVVPLEQVPTTPPRVTSPALASDYALRITSDTWLKQSTAQGSTLPANQKQLVRAGTVIPISSFKRVENNHLRVSFGLDEQGNQIFLQGRNTWYVYQPDAQILRNGTVISTDPVTNPPTPASAPTPVPAPVPNPIPKPAASAYQLKFTEDTWLKQSTAQGSALPDDQRQLIRATTTLPIAGFRSAENNHLVVTFGSDDSGNPVQFKGRNTWYVYQPAVQILKDGRVVDLGSGGSGQKQINAKGLRLLKSFEGLRLEAYIDPVGIWTIGYGTTSGVRPGMKITEAEAEAFLRRDLARFEQAVADLVAVPLNEDQFSALVSFAYNVGEGALANSTLLRLLNRGDFSGATDQFLRWNKGEGGQELYGLTRRRRAERALFLGQDYTAFL